MASADDAVMTIEWICAIGSGTELSWTAVNLDCLCSHSASCAMFLVRSLLRRVLMCRALCSVGLRGWLRLVR